MNENEKPDHPYNGTETPQPLLANRAAELIGWDAAQREFSAKMKERGDAIATMTFSFYRDASMAFHGHNNVDGSSRIPPAFLALMLQQLAAWNMGEVNAMLELVQRQQMAMKPLAMKAGMMKQ